VKLTIMFFLLMMLVACSSVDTSNEPVDTKEPVSEIDSKEPIIEGEWKEAEREKRKIGEALFIINEGY
jgi:major membrane immunogen (membrane-anchored lipoprotein)